MATVVTTGMLCGRMIWARMRSGPAPSSMADSSRSRGILRKFWRSRKTKMALLNKCGAINGSQLQGTGKGNCRKDWCGIQMLTRVVQVI